MSGNRLRQGGVGGDLLLGFICYGSDASDGTRNGLGGVSVLQSSHYVIRYGCLT
jgi:hypothetical protein